ncbi:MAG: DUF131 domain-containing protein [Thaumarchaeota archaeon]|nr:DUF131 domain-containing protein [Nitrososphaerota archaeon]
MRLGILYFIGFAVILAGSLLIFAGSIEGGNASTGGVILIGPFPIVFGSGANGPLLSGLSLFLGVLMLEVFLLSWLYFRAGEPSHEMQE